MNQSQIIRVVVVAGSAIVRMGIVAMLESSPSLFVVKSGADIDEIWDITEIDRDTDKVNAQAVDVVVWDWDGDNWEEINQLSDLVRGIIILADDLDEINTSGFLTAGIKGILPQTSSNAEIIAAVVAIHAGLLVLHPDATINLTTNLSTNLTDDDSSSDYQSYPSTYWQTSVNTNLIPALTTREIEVLKMLAAGLSNKAIAQRLHLSEHTVKFHISSIFQKFSVSTRTEAVMMGVKMGLVMV